MRKRADRLWLELALRAAALCALALVVAACGSRPDGTPSADRDNAPPARSLEVDGVAITLPRGWHGYAERIGPSRDVAVLWASSVAFIEPSPPRGAPPQATLAALPADGVVVQLVAQRGRAESASRVLLTPPLTLADGYFLADAYEGQPAAHVSTQIIDARVGDRALYVQVYFGRRQPDETMRRRANELLASLSVPALPVREERADGFVRFHDPEVGVSGRHPEAWHRARALTNFVSPREVLALATDPLRDRADAGECAPDTAREDLSAGGVFIWLLEYRPARGAVWADLPLERFPPKPNRFELDGELGGNNSCFPGPTYRTTFRAADRPFQLLVAFGGDPTGERLDEVEQILASLEFEEVPPPPPDPYAGWPLINDNPGDSLHPPPGWPAAAAMFPPDTTPRPRTLFFASNRPLPGLPQQLVPYIDELPPPFPTDPLTSFPNDGVLVWIVEERKGGISDSYPAIGRDWPTPTDFQHSNAPTDAPGPSWLRAGGSFRGFRFTLWIATGPDATETDRELALKSAASLAVSGCWRDSFDDCPD